MFALHPAKTKIMYFNNDNGNKKVQISLLGKVLENVSHFKYVGVVLNPSLTHEKHIIHIYTKIVKNVGMLAAARKKIDFEAKKSF